MSYQRPGRRTGPKHSRKKDYGDVADDYNHGCKHGAYKPDALGVCQCRRCIEDTILSDPTCTCPVCGRYPDDCKHGYPGRPNKGSK